MGITGGNVLIVVIHEDRNSRKSLVKLSIYVPFPFHNHTIPQILFFRKGLLCISSRLVAGAGEEWVGTHSVKPFERFYEVRIKYPKGVLRL